MLRRIVISCVRDKLDKTWQMSPPQIGEKPPSGFWLQICSGHDRIQTIDGHAGWAKLTCLSTPKPQRSASFLTRRGNFFLSKLWWIPLKKSTCMCLWKGLVCPFSKLRLSWGTLDLVELVFLKLWIQWSSFFWSLNPALVESWDYLQREPAAQEQILFQRIWGWYQSRVCQKWYDLEPPI